MMQIYSAFWHGLRPRRALTHLACVLVLSLLFLGCKEKDRIRGETYENYVVLVSFDAFRWDYPDMYETPNFDRMAIEGVKAERLIPSFPSKTFPNHYSIATGLYPDHHGIIANKFYAPDLDLVYRIGNRDMVENPDFYGGEPIWVTAELQEVKCASFFWVGSEAPVKGVSPSIWKKYDGSVSFEARVDSVISWLKLPLEKRPRFITLYFQEPDGVGHDYGPEHEQTEKVIEELDIILGDLRSKIAKLPYGNKVNLIVTSDHGMGEISSERYVNIMEHTDTSWIKSYYGGNPTYLIETEEGFAETTAQALNAEEGITAWKKEDIPAYLNYGTHNRIPDVVVVADSGWSVGVKENSSGYIGGTHGYDITNSDMHAIFYADGPAFKDNYIHGSFENVDIYLLIAQILNLEPAKTDGHIEAVEGMLSK